jgi:hypothetical protein
VPVDQAIFTSLVRRGKSGYHLVSRSAGISEGEANALAALAPSHGGLIVDAMNPTSVNFHPLPGGRLAISRTCHGRAEYSGRGARQVYTHSIVFDAARLKRAGYRPFSIYRDALALGYLHYQPDPDPVLKPIALSQVYPRPDETSWSHLAREIGRQHFEALVLQIDAGQNVVLPYDGDRAALAEALVSRLSAESLVKVSFATSLHPSSVRPFRLTLVTASRTPAAHRAVSHPA